MSTPISFYNSLTKKVEPFSPKDGNIIRIYNCGPTVYKRQHIGNMRRFLFADFLKRSLEFFGYEVHDVTNITDAGHLTQDEIDAGEDKVAKAAQEAHVTPQTIAKEQTKLFFQDIHDLNIEDSWKYPLATDHIEEMQQMIVSLLEKKHAYQTETGIYFDVTTWPNYGQLSGNTLNKIDAGSRIAVRNEKKHPADFALWIFDNEALQHWDSPWGVGYPGWHIECSAMSLKYLGTDIDIHTGGEDNRFPHHENEIAQSEASTEEHFVHFWLHNRHLMFKDQKLSKRSGEQITLDTLKEKGFSPLAFRLLVFGSHYRSPLDFSWENLQAAQTNLESFKNLLRRLNQVTDTDSRTTIVNNDIIEEFRSSLANNLNTPQALSVIQNYTRAINTELDTKSPVTESSIRATLKELDKVFGIFCLLQAELDTESIPEAIKSLTQKREEARQQKDFAESDRLRQEAQKQGYEIEDTPTGPQTIKK